MEDSKEQQGDGAKSRLTEAERTQKRERENWMLARAGVLRQLETSSNERYKEFLRRELSELEKKINGRPLD